jgi:hypothetical protein
MSGLFSLPFIPVPFRNHMFMFFNGLVPVSVLDYLGHENLGRNPPVELISFFLRYVGKSHMLEKMFMVFHYLQTRVILDDRVAIELLYELRSKRKEIYERGKFLMDSLKVPVIRARSYPLTFKPFLENEFNGRQLYQVIQHCPSDVQKEFMCHAFKYAANTIKTTIVFRCDFTDRQKRQDNAEYPLYLEAGRTVMEFVWDITNRYVVHSVEYLCSKDIRSKGLWDMYLETVSERLRTHFRDMRKHRYRSRQLNVWRTFIWEYVTEGYNPEGIRFVPKNPN